MFKKAFTALVLSVVLVLSTTNQTSANNYKPHPHVKVKSEETGRGMEIPVVEISSYQDENGDYVVEYEADVPTELLTWLSASKQKWDSSKAIKVTMWMYYDSFDNGEGTWFSVNRYKAKWQRYDSSISLSNAYITMGCQGDRWDGRNCLLGHGKQKL